MSSFRLLFDDQTQAATLTASTTAGSLVASNLLTDDSSAIWRATGTSATITATWTTAISANAAVLGWSNVDASATVTITVWALASDVTPIYSGSITADSKANGKSLLRAWLPSLTFQKLRISISGNGANVEAGRLMVGQAYTMSYAPTYSPSLGWRDTSTVSRSESGRVRREQRPVYRAASFQFSLLNQADAVALRKIASLGRGALGVVSASDARGDYQDAWSFLGVVGQDISESIPMFGRASTTLAIEEAL